MQSKSTLATALGLGLVVTGNNAPARRPIRFPDYGMRPSHVILAGPDPVAAAERDRLESQRRRQKRARKLLHRFVQVQNGDAYRRGKRAHDRFTAQYNAVATLTDLPTLKSR